MSVDTQRTSSLARVCRFGACYSPPQQSRIAEADDEAGHEAVSGAHGVHD